jgi:DNA-binding response OmpR family regulator
VLLIEDDPAVRQGLELALTQQGHGVRAVESGEQGLDRLRADLPDVVVLDLMLPGMDGFEVCRRIRAAGEVPIIMLTARGDDMDVVAGLEAGADDYVVKPVQARVLEARIRAVLRRTGRDQAELERHGDLTIDRAGLVVANRGVPVSLTPTELRLLPVEENSNAPSHSQPNSLCADCFSGVRSTSETAQGSGMSHSGPLRAAMCPCSGSPRRAKPGG